MKNPAYQDLILRDKLALDRTVLANQRTLLSYIKTGIFFMSTAIGLFYLEKKESFELLEWSLTSVGIFAVLLGIGIYFKTQRKINNLYSFD